MRQIFHKFKMLTILIVAIFSSKALLGQENMVREGYLQQLLKVLPGDHYTSPADHKPGNSNPRVTPEDFTWRDWQKRSGELPPDFKKLPFHPFLPNPLILDEGGNNIPIRTIKQWNEKRNQIKRLAQYWITGTIPPSPSNMISKVIEEKKIGSLTERTILLKFGPGHKAQLHVNLLIPPGDGPFPVFMCPWKEDKQDWVQAAVRRGYIGCRFTATDPKYGYPDDSEIYQDIYWPEYNFTTLMRWAWAGSRAIDYLYTLKYINKEQIALTGLSRNGKMALWAAAFDDRIKAVVPISGGTGGENPFMYTNVKYNNESIAEITKNFPYWLNPRLRFFIGRENKLPVDQNLLMALVAPRGLMLTSSIFEDQGNPWGIEQAYLSAKKAYMFLGAEDKIAIDLRLGLHPPAARDMENYLDFFDYVFGRGHLKPANKLYYNYSFPKWLGLSGEMINLLDFPVNGISDLLKNENSSNIVNLPQWNKKTVQIREKINWGLGNVLPSVFPGDQPDYLSEVIIRPQVSKGITSQPFGFGTLYYPDSTVNSSIKKHRLPVVIYIHGYSYPTGYGRNSQTLINNLLKQGFAVYAMDMIGFGTRVEEGRLFYQRFPHWSKMGRMVADIKYSVDALSKIEFLDPLQIYTVGYSLGATVGLYATALDERIAGTVAVCGFTPMRSNIKGKTAEGIYGSSYLHGLLPKLGFFIGEESRIPYDFDGILACIAPRPALIIAPTWDQYADIKDIRLCIGEVQKVYNLLKAKDNLAFLTPEDYNRFTPEMQQNLIEWLTKH